MQIDLTEEGENLSTGSKRNQVDSKDDQAKNDRLSEQPLQQKTSESTDRSREDKMTSLGMGMGMVSCMVTIEPRNIHFNLTFLSTERRRNNECADGLSGFRSRAASTYGDTSDGPARRSQLQSNGHQGHLK